MGVKTWTLLSYQPDWRWGLEGQTTFWYPTMRLFRQMHKENWDKVILDVEESLKKEFL